VIFVLSDFQTIEPSDYRASRPGCLCRSIAGCSCCQRGMRQTTDNNHLWPTWCRSDLQQSSLRAELLTPSPSTDSFAVRNSRSVFQAA